MNVGIYIYDDAEVLDFSGPYEVFTTASRLLPDDQKLTPVLISETGDAVCARAGFRVFPHYGFADHPDLDIIIVVGGVHEGEMTKQPVLSWLQSISTKTELTASVCTGAFLLAEAGVLTDQSVTTHWEDIADLRTRYPSLTVLENQRWVEDGAFITSAGISAGIDMALHLVAKLRGHDVAEATARKMEFDWRKNAA